MDHRTGTKIDEPGGEVISVEIKVNGITKAIRHATLAGISNQTKRYKLDDGRQLTVNSNMDLKGIVNQLL